MTVCGRESLIGACRMYEGTSPNVRLSASPNARRAGAKHPTLGGSGLSRPSAWGPGSATSCRAVVRSPIVAAPVRRGSAKGVLATARVARPPWHQRPVPGGVVARSLPQSGRTGKVIERTTTKSGRSRIVPLLSLALPVVVAHLEGLGPEELLFPASQGGYLHAQKLAARRPMERDHERAPAARPALRGRQSVDRRGVDVKTIGVWLGHSSTKLTLATYGHLMGTDAERAAIEVNPTFGH